MRILLVDDNPDALRVIENFLKALDHTVYAYTDAREALLWLKDVRPEIVVADLDMPGMDGFELIRRLRAYAAFERTPVICITGTDTPDEEIYAAGFVTILRKPVTLADMLDAIDAANRSVELQTSHPPEAPSSAQAHTSEAEQPPPAQAGEQ